MILIIDIFQTISSVLICALLFLGYKFFESTWSYRISKPNNWESSILRGDISTKLKKIERTYKDRVRFYNFWFQVERLKRDKIEGAFVELGVYQGETAVILHEMDKSRDLHLFDTFEGFVEEDLKDELNKDDRYTVSNFSDTQLDTVKSLFSDSSNVFYYKGYFPDTTVDLKETKFSLVNIDADLYKPTIAALNYFYPKLSSGGVLIIHDYNHTWDGAKQAIDEFKATIPECLIEIPDWQGSAMIIKNKKTLDIRH
jgi:O-methyltransferase